MLTYLSGVAFTGSLTVIGISVNCNGVNLCDIPEVYLAAYKYASDVINKQTPIAVSMPI